MGIPSTSAGISPAETLLIRAKAQASVVLEDNMVNMSNNTVVKTVVGWCGFALSVKND